MLFPFCEVVTPADLMFVVGTVRPAFLRAVPKLAASDVILATMVSVKLLKTVFASELLPDAVVTSVIGRLASTVIPFASARFAPEYMYDVDVSPLMNRRMSSLSAPEVVASHRM